MNSALLTCGGSLGRPRSGRAPFATLISRNVGRVACGGLGTDRPTKLSRMVCGAIGTSRPTATGHGDAVTAKRIYSVPLPAVLHVHQRGIPSREVVPRRQSNRPALVRRNDVVPRAVVRHIRAEALQQRIRHAREEADSRRFQRANKFFNINHRPIHHL